jgi:hypothetical protein
MQFFKPMNIFWQGKVSSNWWIFFESVNVLCEAGEPFLKYIFYPMNIESDHEHFLQTMNIFFTTWPYFNIKTEKQNREITKYK